MKISIITVTYNAEATIERTLQSVAQQTHSDIEHIIIDGASTDHTIEIVRRYPHVTLYSEPDKGLYDAMNKGLRKATGNYLCFLNAGDKLHSKETLAHVADSLERYASLENPENLEKPTAIAVLYGDTHIVDAQEHFLRHRRLTPPEHLTWRSFQDGMLICHQSFYINRKIALPYDTTYRFSADFDWCVRCMKEGERLGMANLYIHEPLTDYLVEGITTANHKESLKERFKIMAKHYGLLPTIGKHIWFIYRALVKK